MEDMEDETEEVIDDTALRGLAPLRKLEPNMPDDLLAVSFGSCRNLDSKRLREEGLRPGEGLPVGPWLKASTVRLLLRPVGPLEAPTCWGRCWASDSEGLRIRKKEKFVSTAVCFYIYIYCLGGDCLPLLDSDS